MEKEVVVHQHLSRCPTHHFGLQAEPKPYWPRPQSLHKTLKHSWGLRLQELQPPKKGKWKHKQEMLVLSKHKAPNFNNFDERYKKQVIADDNGILVLEGNWKCQNLWRYESQNIISSLMVSGLDLMARVLRIQCHSLGVCQSININFVSTYHNSALPRSQISKFLSQWLITRLSISIHISIPGGLSLSTYTLAAT